MSDSLPAIGRIGVFSVPLEVMPRTAGVEFAAELEELGYWAVWTGEGLGTREIFTNACGILAGTRSIVFGAGIANVWARDHVTMVTSTRTVQERATPAASCSVSASATGSRSTHAAIPTGAP